VSCRLCYTFCSLLLLLILDGCQTDSDPIQTIQPTDTNLTDTLALFVPTATATLSPSPTRPPLTRTVTAGIDQTPSATPPKPSATKRATPTSTSHPTASATTTETACLRPPDDYARAQLNGETLNGRTLWMLKRAAELYDGPADLLRVTQGSYRSDVASSFGTHAGGGAVDISIRDPADPGSVLWDETEGMVQALRWAGFAAWYRPPGALRTGSPAHIHAIAIGDDELSPAAEEQLIGLSGYFRGMDGLPTQYGGPGPDPHGGPIICGWMKNAGYVDLRD
jgi:hypothetical protein